ncbi:MAG TPA: ATP-binding protein [Candidatus Bilamarchaeaceae archaeon]|nr:ATP-binding protein [Candidatus Bilamarchaeaceae archaeon]
MYPIFQLGGPVTGKDFYGREGVLRSLQRDLVDKGMRGYVIYGARRIGKTSLLMEFKQRITANKKATCIYIDVSSIHPFTLERLYDTMFIESLKAFRPKLDMWDGVKSALAGSATAFSEILKNASIDIVVKDYLTIKFRLKERKADLQELLKNALTAVEKYSERSKTRGIIILDEFQLIEKMEPKTLWAFRAHIQNWKHAAMIVAGSEVSFVEELTINKTAPFYMLFKIENLKPFDKKTSENMILDKFKKLGMHIEQNALEKCHDLTGGYPFYLQWLGDAIYDQKPKKIGIAEVVLAFRALLKESEVIFYSELERISEGEKSVLIELAKGRKRITEVAKRLEKPDSTVAKFVERLIAKGYVIRYENGYKLVDNLLAGWLALTY